MMRDSYTLPPSSYRHSRKKHENRKCNCCPYGYHIDLDFVRYCEKVANSQLLGSPKNFPVRSRTVRKKRESIESLLGIPTTTNKIGNESMDIRKEIKNDAFFDDLKEAVLDFEIMLKSSHSNKSNIAKYKEGTQSATLISAYVPQQKDLFEFEACAVCKSNGTNNESAVRLQDIRTQMATSLKKMKELEDDVKLLPELKNQLKILCWENRRLTKLVETKEENVDNFGEGLVKGDEFGVDPRDLDLLTLVAGNTGESSSEQGPHRLKHSTNGNGNHHSTVQTRTIGTGNNVLQRNVAVAAHARLISIGTDPIIANVLSTPKLNHVQTNTDSHAYYLDARRQSEVSKYNFIESSNLSGDVIKRPLTKNIGIQAETLPVLCTKKNVATQIKPICSNVHVYTELYSMDSVTQTPLTQKKDVGVGINIINSLYSVKKCDIGINTEKEKKIDFASKSSDTTDLLKTADVSVNTAKKKRVDASVETCPKLCYSIDKVGSSMLSKMHLNNNTEEKKKSTHVPISLRGKNNERGGGASDELQEKLFRNIPVVSKRLEKKDPTKEMKGAMKVLSDSLQNSACREMPLNMKNAINIIQQEWFKISSTAEANPLDVEDYLDCFEEMSVTLLEYIVNMTDISGNTAMHYAVSNGNFDVVSILLDSKVCNINKLNAAGYTCIMLVALTKAKTETDRQVVRRLFHMADVNIRAKQHGQTALMLAVSHGRIDTVQLLLESGADINIQDEDGSTALMCAAEHGYIDIIKILLGQPDCDLSITDLDGNTALAIAMEAGNRDIGVLLYAQEHFTRTNSPFGSLKIRRAKSATPTLRTRSPTSLNCSQEHSL